MSKAKFVSKVPQFLKKNDAFIDVLYGHMAMDIERLAKMKVPVSNTKASGNKRGGGGHLQSSIYHERVRRGFFRVVANKKYAAYQERGARIDGSRVVKKYSTPGTGKHWFKNAIDNTKRNRDNYIREARRAVGL
jgi:hypothetical protein